MLRVTEDRLARADLDDLAEIHHGDTMADAFDDGHVVRDEEIGELHLRLQLEHQVDHLRLDRNVERRDRLVRHDQPRLDGERARDADALTLAARKFMRETARHVGHKADAAQQLGDLVGRLRSGCEFVDQQGLRDCGSDSHARVQTGEWILEDHLHVLAPLAQLVLVQLQHVFAVEQNGAAVSFGQPHHRAAGGRLAAAGFTDKCQGLACLHAE